MIRKPGAALVWWQSLQPDPDRGRAGDRAALARLRRCATVAEAMAEAAAIDLFRRCEADNLNDLPTVALTAAVLAHVRRDAPKMPVARRIGPDSPDSPPESALLKPLRFQRLMQAREPDERLVLFRRLVMLADRELNVRDLSEATLFWTGKLRRQWTYLYWSASPSDPAADAIAPTA